MADLRKLRLNKMFFLVFFLIKCLLVGGTMFACYFLCYIFSYKMLLNFCVSFLVGNVTFSYQGYNGTQKNHFNILTLHKGPSAGFFTGVISNCSGLNTP